MMTITIVHKILGIKEKLQKPILIEEETANEFQNKVKTLMLILKKIEMELE